MEGERIREDTPSQHLTKSSMELRESAKHYFLVCVCVYVCVYVCMCVRFVCRYIIRRFNMTDVCTLLYYRMYAYVYFF